MHVVAHKNRWLYKHCYSVVFRTGSLRTQVSLEASQHSNNGSGYTSHRLRECASIDLVAVAPAQPISCMESIMLILSSR